MALLGAVWMAAAAQDQASADAGAQGKLAGAAPVTYANRYEVYGGINFMNFQAGQYVTERMNLAGIEVLGTYWLTHKIGLGLDFRGDDGTTPTLPIPAAYYKGRPLVELYTGMAGVQYRGPKNQHAAMNYHAYGGLSHGIFDETAGIYAPAMGLYPNHTAPIFALGGNVDFNRSKQFAIRLQPDLILEQFGSGTREFFSISGGIVYRIGKK
jgi:hypothetical protein